MTTEITLIRGRDYTPTAYVRFLNNNFTKKSGVAFTIRDVYQYCRRGTTPKRYGGHKIERIIDTEIGLNILRITNTSHA